MAIPQHGPQNKLTKLYNYGHKYQNGLHKQIVATPKLTHIRSNKRSIAIFGSFLAFPRPRSTITFVSLVCTSDPRLLPVTMWRHTGRQSGSRTLGGKQESVERNGHLGIPSRPQVKENSRQYMLFWSDNSQKTVVGPLRRQELPYRYSVDIR